MAISDVRWKLGPIGPVLSFTFNGEHAEADWRQGFYETGYVQLQPALVWDELLPPVDLPADPATGRGAMTLTAATDDPDVVAAFERFSRAANSGSFREGPPR